MPAMSRKPSEPGKLPASAELAVSVALPKKKVRRWLDWPRDYGGQLAHRRVRKEEEKEGGRGN
jgi:hypothetical protein